MFRHVRLTSTCRTSSPALALRRRLEALEERTVPAGFDFPDFSNPAPLNLVGSAAITPDNVLRLTPAIAGRVGAAWYIADKQLVGASFETTFQFRLTEPQVPTAGSDGFAFVIQNRDASFVGGGGGNLAYNGLFNSVAVEFDTFQNTNFADPSPSHISVHSAGVGPNNVHESASLGSYSTLPVLLDDEATHSALIRYTPGTLEVYFDGSSAPVISAPIDLAETLDLSSGQAWVGFTGACGGGWQNHDILNWRYDILADVATTVAVADVSAVEGNAANTIAFTVTRSGNTAATTTLDWATEDRTAIAGSDYVAASGTVTFGPGVTQRTIAVTVVGDAAPELHETFAVRLTNPNGGSIADGFALGTLLNDDASIAIDDTTVTEGDPANRQIDNFVPTSSGPFIPRHMAFGPDGHLYVADTLTSQVLRYDKTSGAFLGAFVPYNPAVMRQPFALAFGPDGNLYVGDGNNAGTILRFNGQTGAFLDVFATLEGAGQFTATGIAFGPDGNLYVSRPRGASNLANAVLRHQGPNGPNPGAFLGTFTSDATTPSLLSPRGLAFGPDGNLYVAAFDNDSVLRFSGGTGTFLGTFVAAGTAGLDSPVFLTFAPGGLYVASSATTGSVLRFAAGNAAFLGVAVPVQTGGSGEVLSVFSSVVDPSGNCYAAVGTGGSAPTYRIVRYGPASQAVVTVRLDSPSAVPVTVQFATANGTAVAGSDFLATAGTLTFSPGQTIRTILVRTLNDALSEGGETFAINLTNASGAALVDNQAIVILFDDEPALPRVASVSANGAAGVQRSRVTSVTVAFNATVTFAGAVADAFTVSRIGGGPVGSFTATATVVNGITVVTLSNFTGAETQFGSLADGRYALTVRAAQVFANGQPLDGNGDGLGGDDYTLAGSVANGLYRLYGDANGDGVVNAVDFGQFRTRFGTAIGQPAYVDWLDLDGDGFINAFDFAQFRTRFGSSVP